ncbi:MAG: chromate transporter [Planctomycetota bacterium]|jgi:chromate transporter|nr:chromate transporter [Planctomycetota bacterium]
MDEHSRLPLVISFLKIGLFGFGGGYAILPLIGREVVDVRRWLNVGEFADILALSQMTPGPVALNTATYVGFIDSGVVGAAFATLSVCLPPFVIMFMACRFFMSIKDNPRTAGALRLLRPSVVGLVLAAALMLVNRHSFPDWKSVPLFITAFLLTVCFRTNPIFLLVGAGIFGWLFC